MIVLGELATLTGAAGSSFSSSVEDYLAAPFHCVKESPMGTKNNPGQYDCYDKADPDEPIFTLRAKDDTAPFTIRMWVAWRLLEARVTNMPVGASYGAKLDEALACADAMEKWKADHGAEGV
jgi:hypothetical protein